MIPRSRSRSFALLTSIWTRTLGLPTLLTASAAEIGFRSSSAARGSRVPTTMAASRNAVLTSSPHCLVEPDQVSWWQSNGGGGGPPSPAAARPPRPLVEAQLLGRRAGDGG